VTLETDGITEADFARLRERFNPASDDLARMAAAVREVARERREREQQQLECAARVLRGDVLAEIEGETK